MGMGDEEEIGKGDKQTDRQRQRVGDGEMVTKRKGRERETERQRVGDGEMVMRRREREEGKGMEGRDRELGMGR